VPQGEIRVNQQLSLSKTKTCTYCPRRIGIAAIQPIFCVFRQSGAS